MQLLHRTWIELSKQALYNNCATIKRLIGTTQLAAVIKGNAYGHGLVPIGLLLNDHPLVDILCTAGTSEALDLRAAGVQKPILALAYLDSNLAYVLKQQVELVVYTPDDIQLLDETARALGVLAHVHVKVDTGMSRLGLLPQDMIPYIQFILKHKHIALRGILTHLADTIDPHQEFTHQQLACFSNVLKELEHIGITIPAQHLISSGALFLANSVVHSFVRVGSSLYGFWKSQAQHNAVSACFTDATLTPVLTWKTSVIQLKHVPAGSFIGYNRTVMVKRSTSIAVLPVGYYDGYPRSLSNKASVLINNQYAPSIGTISMNLITVDVTDIPNVTTGTEVVLMGNAAGITAPELADQGGTIANELLTHINPEIPRIIVP